MAVREGLINALVHRDYEAYEGTVNVEIHKDHLVISNTGGLYGGMTIERLKAGHLSAFRNPDMANYLNVRGFMEMTGRGCFLIQKACRMNGLPEPEWEADERSVTLTFYAKSGMLRQSVQQGGKKEDVGSKTVQETGRAAQETTQETGLAVQETTQENMMGVAERILDMVRKAPFITTSEMANRLGMTRSGVNYHLATLKRDFGLHHEGPTKKGRWILPELR